jgi:hypothetical protein
MYYHNIKNIWNDLVIAFYRSDTSKNKHICSCKLPVLCKIECKSGCLKEIEHGEFSVMILMDIRNWYMYVACDMHATRQKFSLLSKRGSG